MPHVAAHEPMSAEALIEYANGRPVMGGDRCPNDTVVGYVDRRLVAGCAHIEQLSVHPAHQGAGLGRALVARVERWAEDKGLSAVTLTTFRDVPWNRPLYEHLGYAVLTDDELTPELRQDRG